MPNELADWTPFPTRFDKGKADFKSPAPANGYRTVTTNAKGSGCVFALTKLCSPNGKKQQIHLLDGIYHVTLRGKGGLKIFFSNNDGYNF